MYLHHKMTTCVQCVWYNLIFFLCWTVLVSPEEPLLAPTAGIGDNASLVHHHNEQEQEIGSDSAVSGDLKASVEVQASFEEKGTVEDVVGKKQIFAEATSQNSGLANDMTNSGLPVVVTLSDVATAELQQRAILSSQNEPDQSLNQKGPPGVKDSSNQTGAPAEPSESVPEQLDDKDVNLEPPASPKDNLTEEIPSFSEWTQKRLEEAEKKKEPSNGSVHQHHVNGKHGSGAKLRWKNYASLDCGAKVVASNPEAVSPSAILSPSKDEYILNTCTSRIWFIVELCEAIQAKKIDFANFELFSSSPKDFTVSISDRFPTREWSAVGQFTAKDERDIQSYDLQPHLFGKYIKVEVKSHYGSEHYCPISLLRVYGTSEFEVLQKEDPVHADRIEEEEDDDDELDVDFGDSSKNLFSSATDAVISIVKKAAEVLGNKGNNSNHSSTDIASTPKYTPLVSCCSPSHLVVCNNSSDVLFERVYELLSCRNRQIANLVAIPWIRKSLINSNACQEFGFDFKFPGHSTSTTEWSYLRSVFPKHYLGAMCNSLAISENKVALNVSSTTNVYTNATKNEPEDLVNIETSELHIIAPQDATEEVEVTDVLTVDITDAVTKSSCSTDVSYASQIKPTKTLSSSQLNLKESSTDSIVLPVEISTVTDSSVEGSAEIDGSDKIAEENRPDMNDRASEATPESDSNIMAVTESSETLDDHLEHFINEINGYQGGGQNVPVVPSSITPQAQKESVFLRLSNRIKALERNMSLSGQYLEELSKRYKKQVEEMQKLLDKTILNMKEEIKKKNEQNKQLEEHMRLLSEAVRNLATERNSWSSILSSAVLSTLMTIVILTFCRRSSRDPATEPDESSPKTELLRRQSIDVLTHITPKKKKRRPSDQALKIVRSSMMGDDNAHNITKVTKKKRKKQQALNRSNSIVVLHKDGDYRGFKPAVTSSKVWHRPDSAPLPDMSVDWVESKRVDEIPFVLEESEHSTLEPVMLPDGDVAAAPSVPSFVKTALNFRRERLSVNGVTTKKSLSVDDSRRKSSPVPSLSEKGGVEESHSPKKERKGFKKIFKRVF